VSPGVEVGEQRQHTTVDVVAHSAHLVDGCSGRVTDSPVPVPLALRDLDGAHAATHRDDDLGCVQNLGRKGLGVRLREVDAELRHDLDDTGIDVGAQGTPGGMARDAPLRAKHQQCRCHLAAAGVSQADEEYVACFGRTRAGERLQPFAREAMCEHRNEFVHLCTACELGERVAYQLVDRLP